MGDLRAAINELESLSQGSSNHTLVKRDKMSVMKDVLNDLFRAKTPAEAKYALNNSGSDYSGLFTSYFLTKSQKQYRSVEENRSSVFSNCRSGFNAQKNISKSKIGQFFVIFLIF